MLWSLAGEPACACGPVTWEGPGRKPRCVVFWCDLEGRRTAAVEGTRTRGLEEVAVHGRWWRLVQYVT